MAPAAQPYIPVNAPQVSVETYRAVRATVIEVLGAVLVTVDELVLGCAISAPGIGLVLLGLELAGRLDRLREGSIGLIT